MYKHILVATDGSEFAAKGVDAGLALAKALQASVTLVTVSEPWHDAMPADPSGIAVSGELIENDREQKQAYAERLINDIAAQAESAGVDFEGVFVPDRTPADGILETALAKGADLVVMASHGRKGLRRLLLGSQAQAVLTRGELPVLMVR